MRQGKREGYEWMGGCTNNDRTGQDRTRGEEEKGIKNTSEYQQKRLKERGKIGASKTTLDRIEPYTPIHHSQ